MTRAYHHEPLVTPSSIRLLDLLPSLNQQALIRCKIRRVQLGNSDARYEALSYVWGARQGTVPITCNGQDLLVTPNCVAALTRLRRSSLKRTLWIDAICIDQGTDAAATSERNKQVAMMGEIYRSAQGVIVWLGPGNGELTPRVFRYLKVLTFFKNWSFMDAPRVIRRMGEIVKPYIANLAWPDGPGVYDRRKPRRRGAAFASLIETLDSEWFSRTWTMQETITYGRCTVMCGTCTMEWNEFTAAAREAGASHHSNATANLLYLRGRLAEETLYPDNADRDLNWKNMHDIQLLKAMCKLQCTIPLDKIYGLFAILRPRGLQLPDPDYNRPLVEVLEETARAYVQYKKKLDILRITLPPSESSSLPSWIPDWLSGVAIGQLTHSDITGTAIVTFSDSPYYISSCRDTLVTTTDIVPRTPGKLTVKGKHVGSIKTLSAGPYAGAQPVKEHSHFSDFIPICREWCQMVASAEDYPTGEDPVLAGLRAVTNHRGFFLNGRAVDREHLLLWYEALLKGETTSENTRLDEGATQSGSNSEYSINAEDLLTSVEKIHMVQSYVNYKVNYAFFRLDSGYFGSAFNTSCEGDDVYLLAGLDVPCALRRRGDEFKFIALAHVQGIMEGELWPENQDDLEELTLI
ncbi:heterokaryon incompatibility protein-domain-containing protein [Xylaria arbuscula]|nr:heterokaryon incompatibility protein-domain-containing protein [Xylaria arbuscula]